MWAVLAMMLGLLSVAYAIWPVRHRDSARPLGDRDALSDDMRERVSTAARRWSEAAGELRRSRNDESAR